MSHKPVIDIEACRRATDEIRDEKYAAVRILGHATLNLYERLEKIPSHSIIKTDSLELFNRIDKLVALFRDSPYKDMKGNAWTNKLFAEIGILEPFINAFPKQIQKTKAEDEYVLRALQSYCEEVSVARKEIDKLGFVLRKLVNGYLGQIFSPFDQISKTLKSKATEFGITLEWKEPPPPAIPVIEEPIVEEKFEVTIEHIKQETDILLKLKAIEKTLQAESDSFETIETELEEQKNNKELLKKLIRANSTLSLKEVGASIQTHEEQVSAIETKTLLNPILEVIQTYQAPEVEEQVSPISDAEHLQALSFDELAVLYERIQTTTNIISLRSQTLENSPALALQKPEKPQPLDDNLESGEAVQPKKTGWFEAAGVHTYTEEALKEKNRELREQLYQEALKTYNAELKAYDLQTQALAQAQTLQRQVLLKDMELLQLANNIIAGILENAADQKIIGLERLMLKLKELRYVPITEQLEEEKKLPPRALTRSEKINQFYKKLIRSVVNPIIIIWEIVIHLRNKFNPNASKSAELDNDGFYLDEENQAQNSSSSTHESVVDKLNAVKRMPSKTGSIAGTQKAPTPVAKETAELSKQTSTNPEPIIEEESSMVNSLGKEI